MRGRGGVIPPNVESILKNFLTQNLEDITYLAGSACVSVGLFTSPFSWAGWLAIGAALIYFSHQMAKAGAE